MAHRTHTRPACGVCGVSYADGCDCNMDWLFKREPEGLPEGEFIRLLQREKGTEPPKLDLDTVKLVLRLAILVLGLNVGPVDAAARAILAHRAES